jgi:methylmalonyl-CoA mutase N-terminal domain/subunit
LDGDAAANGGTIAVEALNAIATMASYPIMKFQSHNLRTEILRIINTPNRSEQLSLVQDWFSTHKASDVEQALQVLSRYLGNLDSSRKQLRPA